MVTTDTATYTVKLDAGIEMRDLSSTAADFIYVSMPASLMRSMGSWAALAQKTCEQVAAASVYWMIVLPSFNVSREMSSARPYAQYRGSLQTATCHPDRDRG